MPSAQYLGFYAFRAPFRDGDGVLVLGHGSVSFHDDDTLSITFRSRTGCPSPGCCCLTYARAQRTAISCSDGFGPRPSAIESLRISTNPTSNSSPGNPQPRPRLSTQAIGCSPPVCRQPTESPDAPRHRIPDLNLHELDQSKETSRFLDTSPVSRSPGLRRRQCQATTIHTCFVAIQYL